MDALTRFRCLWKTTTHSQQTQLTKDGHSIDLSVTKGRDVLPQTTTVIFLKTILKNDREILKILIYTLINQ